MNEKIVPSDQFLSEVNALLDDPSFAFKAALEENELLRRRLTEVQAALNDAVQTARNYYALFHDETWKERVAKWEAAVAKSKGSDV